MRSTRARSASRRRLPGDVRTGSGRDEERSVAVGLALFFGCLAAADASIVVFVDELRLPAAILLVYFLSLIVTLLFALWRRRARA